MTKFKKLKKGEILNIHLALHNGSESVLVQGRNLAIFKRPSGANCVLVNDLEFFTQNKDSHSIYSEKVRKGEKISWGRNPLDLSCPYIKCIGTEITIPKEYSDEKNLQIQE